MSTCGRFDHSWNYRIVRRFFVGRLRGIFQCYHCGMRRAA